MPEKMMKTIEVDEELYRYIAGNTRHIGESASDILRRLLKLDNQADVRTEPATTSAPGEGVLRMLDAGTLSAHDSAIERFMTILSVLYRDNPVAFAQASDIKGRKRIYFADSESALLAAGNTTKPRAIEGSPYWVITNTNTGRKRNIVTQLMAAMGYAHGLIERVSKSI